MNELKIENQWIWKEMESNMNVHSSEKNRTKHYKRQMQHLYKGPIKNMQ